MDNRNMIFKQIVLPRVVELFIEYPEAFDIAEREYIVNHIDWILYNNNYNYLLREVYDYLNLINNDENLYLGFTNMIEKNFDINKNIVEVGGGILPSLASKIALKQKQGTITVYDPRLYSDKSDIKNLKLKQEKFNLRKISKKTDLYIGLHPYGGTHSIIKAACKTNTDFIIALGELPLHKNEFVDQGEYDSLQRQFIYDAKQLLRDSSLGKLEETSLEQYGSIYPVIYNKRK